MPHSSLTAAHLKPTEHRDFSKRGVEDTYYAEMQGLSMPFVRQFRKSRAALNAALGTFSAAFKAFKATS